MPRKVRFNLIGIPQHVIQRGNNREPCFYTRSDYLHYLNDLKISSKKYNCRIHAYVLMTNHVHLLVTPMNEYSVSEMMQSLGGRYVRYINKTYKRTGTLWEGRFKSSLVDSDAYLLLCMRYIELNPVSACMVEHPAEYQWSSYQVNAQNMYSDLIEKHPVYLALNNNIDKRLINYRELFIQYLSEKLLHEIRDAVNHELFLGRSYFKNKIKDMTGRNTIKGVAGRPKIEDPCGTYLIEL